MEFILERQQQFADDILLLRDSQAEFQEQVKQAHAAFDIRLMRLAESTLTTFGQLSEAQKKTDERLNILVGVVERLISERREGQP